MMVRNDQIHPVVRCEFCRFRRRNAAIRSHDERRSLLGGLHDPPFGKAVPLLLPVGNVDPQPSAQFTERSVEERGCGDSVHIVITPECDQLASIHRSQHSVDRLLHISHEKGVMHIGEARLQKGYDLFSRCVATHHQESHERKRKFKHRSQLSCGGLGK
ncbi:hypothetical protein AMJ40_01085 [candidate division TA06 bacterium DG_26]|uniref:Uncharacterized protein n=1 Tax=candidate division TA06 bacterium DG_26 TaxID=1703771 RepID=A0A0S7WLV6_UNCT6|nr:MAG: hypothetical protein AMJ40_01085 [candidate division TA06 bacterium DG_26]